MPKRKSPYHYKSLAGLERAVYNQQDELIQKRFGKTAAENANFGWGVAQDGDVISVCTKIYRPQGVKYLTTNASLGDCIKDFQHEIV